VDFEAQAYQVLDDLLNLVFTCGFLHCDDHRKSALGIWHLAVTQGAFSYQLSAISID